MEEKKTTLKDRIVEGCKTHKKQILMVVGGIGAALGIGGIIGIAKHANGDSVIVESDENGYEVIDTDADTVEVIAYSDEDSE